MRYALIGCGRIAINHLKACINNQLSLCALCDIDLNKIERLLGKSGLLSTGDIHRYKDYQKLILEEKPDLVSIATESGSHAEIALFCIRNNVHVIIEKPIALSMQDADLLIEMSEKYHVKVCSCHQNRFNPAVQALRHAIEEGRFGKISHGSIHVRWNRSKNYYNQADWRGTWENDGGALMNQCIHGIDLLRWMLGNRIDEVYGQTRQQFHHYLETEDVGMAVVKFENGAIATIEGTTNVYPENMEESLYIFGEKGTVKIGGTSTNNIEIWQFLDEKQDDEKQRNIKEETSNVYGNGHTALFADMIDAVERNRKPYVDAEAGRNALELVLAIYKSQKESAPVKMPLAGFSSIDMMGTFCKGRSIEYCADSDDADQNTYYLHETSSVDENVQIGKGSVIWHYTHLQKNAVIGMECTIGQNVNISEGVKIGNYVKIQNNVSVYSGVILEDYVFCGPSCVFTNDMNPRSRYPKGKQRYKQTIVKEGASIGANATIVCGNIIGKNAMIGAGAVVVRDIPDYALVVGVPARQIGWVCECGNRLDETLSCRCGMHYEKSAEGLQKCWMKDVDRN